MATVVVTGGAGFIGSHIVDAFVKRGDEVHVIDNLSSGFKENIPSKAKLHELDIRSPKARDLLIKLKPELLVHAAAQMSVRESMRDPLNDTEVNVAGWVNLLQAFQSGPAPYVVFLSTGGAMYGDQDVYPAPETLVPQPTSVYGLAKRTGELYLDLWNRAFSVPGVALRLANIFGPRQNPHGEAGVVAIFSEALIHGKKVTFFGDGSQTRDYMHVDDVVSAVLVAVEKRPNDILNIGTGEETSVTKLLSILMKASGIETTPILAPERPGEQKRSSIDPARAGKVLGWRSAVSLEDGLAQTVAWCRNSR